MKFNNETIRTAVKEYFEDSKKAEEKYGHISNWDVSGVTDMSKLFSFSLYFHHDSLPYKRREEFNEDISNWVVSNVTDMSEMFEGVDLFNQEIGKWDVSSVTNLSGMFGWTESFNKDIGNWDVSNVTDMNCMFYNAQSFNQDISKWDVSNVTDMGSMFGGAESFNQNIGNWNVSNVTNMGYMFGGAESFNQDLGNWDLQDVYMDGIFDGAISFKQDTNKWKWMDKILHPEDKEEEKGFMHIAMVNSTFYYEEDGENIFYAKELFIENGGSWSDADGEFEVMEKIVNELKCEDLIFTDIVNEDGEYELHRLTDLPKIFDREGDGDGGHHGPFYSDEELIDYVKKLKEISYKKLNPNNDDEVDLTYSDIFSGVRKTYHENGNIETERTYVDGVEHGPAKGWFESGELEFEAFKENGLVQGLVKNYYENGNLRIETNYIDQVKHGYEKIYYDNEQLGESRNYENGIICGVEKIYNEDGDLQSETEHKATVSRVNWDETEDVGIITHYKDKPFTGVAFCLHENGNLEEETEMLEGLKHGKQVYYSEDSSVSSVSYYENDLRIGCDENTYDNITNEYFPEDKYDDMQKILFTIDILIRVTKAQDEENDIKQYSEVYYEALSTGIVDSMKRLNKFSDKAIDQAEEMYAKINSTPCEKTIKFTDELKKYVKSHNDTAAIDVYPSKYGVWEEFTHKGQWKNKNFKMKIIIPLKNAEFEYDGSLSDFIEQIGTKNITQLDNSNLDLGLLGDSGGSYEVADIIWDEKLSKSEEKIFNENDILREWLANGMISDDDKIVFEDGCVYEIKVTVGDKVFTLVK